MHRASLAAEQQAMGRTLRSLQDQPSADQNILVHHIGGVAQLMSGREPADALLDFLAFAGKDPLVAFHADFDRLLIERVMRTALGYKPDNAWLDLALLAPALFPPDAPLVASLMPGCSRSG